MKTEKGHLECIFMDNSREDFEKLCTSVEEFGKDKDMMSFKSKNHSTENSVLLQIVPKREIKRIICRYSEEDMKRVWEE